ncbi:MAG TPA: D-ribose pyranase [Polaromonas sp.]|uniref:D-ribose pyranase n=1 Tax=Polaromonas sp. TaxID=1869339 RepID=UPI002D492D3B|nr:D-ribose pyranase [Polaromonas sp.]HYW56236.1 D-ribose pyranase [Polaromonas sp.]
MKKTALLNAALSGLVAAMGHGDTLVIGDAGLPVPPGVPVIDLAVSPGTPSLQVVLAAVLSELRVESYIVATELDEADTPLNKWIASSLDGTVRQVCSHADLKLHCAKARAVVRTGEFTPYANVILSAGVVF